jgi:hypothetical protein
MRGDLKIPSFIDADLISHLKSENERLRISRAKTFVELDKCDNERQLAQAQLATTRKDERAKVLAEMREWVSSNLGHLSTFDKMGLTITLGNLEAGNE